jgi:hypothetical protein
MSKQMFARAMERDDYSPFRIVQPPCFPSCGRETFVPHRRHIDLKKNKNSFPENKR